MEEKVQKDRIIGELMKQYEDDLETIIPYSTTFSVIFYYIIFVSIRFGIH